MKRSVYINIIFACVCFVQYCTTNNNDNQPGMISVSDFKKLLGEELAKLDKIYKAELKIRDEKYQQEIENLRNEMLTYRKNFQRQILKYKKTIENQQQEMGVRITEMESQNSIFQNDIDLNKNKLDRFIEACEIGKRAGENEDEQLTNTGRIGPPMQHSIKGRKRQVQNTTKAAFYACLYNGTNHLGNNQDIAFENALLNIGNSYNVHHGTFVAPVHGVYVFSATLARDGSQSWAHFMKNGHMIGKFDFADQWAVSSQTNVVELKKGDDVSVQNKAIDRGYRGDCFSSFAGFLLSEMNDDIVAIVGK